MPDKKRWDEMKKKVTKRDGRKCVHCDKTEGLHLSHIYPRGLFRHMTYLPENGFLACYYFHIMYWHKHPIGAYKWYIKNIPLKRRKLLERLSKIKKKK